MPANAKIHHVIIIFKENHCFDNYFGRFPGANGIVVDQAANPPPQDYDHRHGAWLKRKSYYETHPRIQYTENDIPAYFAYARQFTLCDNYFTDVAGPSTPNHLMVIAADSPIIDNPRRADGPPSYNIPSLPISLENAGLTWGNYGGYAFEDITELKGKQKRSSLKFKSDAASGNLPNVSWVFAPTGKSEHPEEDIRVGMNWTVEQVNAVVQGRLWSNSVIFITWDDWGGWFDHVDPPNVETWNDDGTHPSYDGTQFRYGSRVGCIVLSPYAKSGYISKILHSHVSLVKFCETNLGLSPLNQRDADADDMSDCFNFTQQPLDPPRVNP